MDKKEFKTLIRECIEDVLTENLSDNDPLYVEYHSQRQGEEPFMLGGTKYEYVNAKYPNGKIDIGVYSFAEDLVYSYNSFRRRHNIQEGKNNKVKSPPQPKVRKSWGNMNPVSRIHGQGKERHKPKYDRNRDKNWKKDLGEGGEETFYKDAQDHESDAAQVRNELEMIKKAGLEKEYESLMNGIFNLPIGEFDKRANAINQLKNKASQILGLGLDENKTTDKVNEMTTTSAAQGFYGKNWVDPDPKRKRMKDIAAKSVGGKVT